ncbi:MAG: hypothetical protein GXO91_04370 [FCB group bacterium]|nr:hypothetical protein [FCB group bacterium]
MAAGIRTLKLLIVISSIMSTSWAQSVREAGNITLNHLDGIQLRFEQLFRDGSPTMLIFLQPGDVYSDRYIEQIRVFPFGDYRDDRGLRTILICRQPVQDPDPELLKFLFDPEYRYQVSSYGIGSLTTQTPLTFFVTDHELFRRLGLSGLPSVLLIQDSEITFNSQGPLPGDQMAAMLDKRLSQTTDDTVLYSSTAMLSTEQILSGLRLTGEEIFSFFGVPDICSWTEQDDWYRYPGFDVSPGGPIRFTEKYTDRPLTRNLGMSSDRATIERFLGKPTDSELKDGYEKVSYVGSWLSKRQIVAQYDPDTDKLHSLLIRYPEGREALLTSDRNISTMDNLLGIYRQPVAQMTQLLGEPELTVPNPNDPDVTTYFYMSNGLGLHYSKSADKIAGMVFMNTSEANQSYPHPLPFGVSWTSSYTDIIASFGKPVQELAYYNTIALSYDWKGIQFFLTPSDSMLFRMDLYPAALDNLVKEAGSGY